VEHGNVKHQVRTSLVVEYIETAIVALVGEMQREVVMMRDLGVTACNK